MKTKKVTISLTPEQQEKARSLSKYLFGEEADLEPTDISNKY